jgi:hypothetical protein
MSYDQIGTRFSFGYPGLRVYHHSLVINSSTILECYANIYKFINFAIMFHCSLQRLKSSQRSRITGQVIHDVSNDRSAFFIKALF